MSTTSHDDLTGAVHKLRHAKRLLDSSASRYIIDALADAICLIETHACPEPPKPPKPAYVFRVGQVVHLTTEVDALPIGAVVRTNTHRTAEKRPTGWQATSIYLERGHTVGDRELFGATIIYLNEVN